MTNSRSASDGRSLDYGSVDELVRAFRRYGEIQDDGVEIRDPAGFRENVVDRLVYSAIFAERDTLTAARWLIWESAQALDCRPASIHEYYMAGGQGAWSNRTTPAINVRGLTYDVARAIFRVRARLDVGQQIFEIARSEIGYTGQRPHEYSAAVLGAALREGYTGPVFIQGDHFQLALDKFRENPDQEVKAVQGLALEALNAGFYNIDVDASTIVDYDLQGEVAQQEGNARRTAEITAYIRAKQPDGIEVSVGGEIGEVGTQNSTVAELRAFMDHFNRIMGGRGAGISKISVQTGTSHGGVPLPDGTVADVAVDFETLGELSKVSREEYALSGAVQHGASTLPDEAFGLFAEANACEVHLATGFQNIIFDHASLPTDLKEPAYAWLAKNRASERKEGETDAQFYYKTRKRAFGPFKRAFWEMDGAAKQEIIVELESRFELMFNLLGVSNTTADVVELTPTPRIAKAIPQQLKDAFVSGD